MFGPRKGSAPSFPESRFSTFCSWPQIKDDQPVVLENAAIAGTQVIMKYRIMLEPPECGECEGNESRARVSQPLDFPNRCGVIRERPGVLAVSLKERDRAVIAAELVARDVLIDKNKRIFRRD